MNLKELNDLQSEGDELLKKAKRIEDQSEYLARRRKDMTVLSKFISDIEPNDGQYLAEIQSEVLRIVDSMSHDVFRAVEMKFASDVRELRIEAKLKQQQISNFFHETEEKK